MDGTKGFGDLRERERERVEAMARVDCETARLVEKIGQLNGTM